MYEYLKQKLKDQRGFLGLALGAAATAYSAYTASQASKRATQGQADANAANFAESARNRAFQERMSRNKHQYQVEDLRAAGLNPILSATAGAPVPSGSTASAQSTQSHQPSHAIAKQQLMANLASTAADVLLKQKLAEKAGSETDLNKGRWGIPGFISGPISSAKDYFNKHKGRATKAWQIAKDYARTGSFAKN